MKLTYRGVAYETNPSQVNLAKPTTKKLIYRGLTVDHPPKKSIAAMGETNLQIFPLIYRGVTYTRPVLSIIPYHHRRRAINWRFQQLFEQSAS